MKGTVKYLFLLTALLAVLLSCTRESLPSVEETEGSADESIIRAYAERVDTKGHVDGGTGAFTWSAGDKIAVWTEENGYLTGELTAGSETGTATFEVPLHGATRSGYAIYPESAAYEGAPGTNGTPLAISLPSVRRIDNSKTGWNNLVEVPMVAVNTPGQDLQFKYACAMVRLTLKNVPSSTRFIRVTDSRSMAGYFAVDTSDPSAPGISSDNTLGGGNLSYVVFQFKSNVSGTVSVNLPVPGGVRHSLVVSTHPTDTYDSYAVGLRPGAYHTRATSRFSLGEQRDFERGVGYAFELDCSKGVAYSMDTFSVPDATVFEAQSSDLAWSILRNNAENQLVTISGLSINSYVEDPEIADVTVIDREWLYYTEDASYRPIIRVKGLKVGSTKLVTTAVRGEDILTAVSTITVKKRGYHIYFRAADKVLTGGSTPLTAYFRRDGVESTADSYEWVITEGADLATIEDSPGQGPDCKWLKAGNQEGTVTIVCKAFYDGMEVTSEPVSIRIMADAPEGAVRGLFTVDQQFNNVFFSHGNLLWEEASGKYMFFDSQIGYHLLKSKPSGKPYTQVMADLFNEIEGPRYWSEHPMNQSRVYTDFDSDDFTTGWYDLTVREWDYLLFTRRGVTLNGVENARFGRCSVKNEANTNIRCIMLFPDGYVHPDGIPFPGSINLNPDTAGYSARVYTMAEMLALQDAGVVFLPLTGTYERGSYLYSLTGGLYYTSTTGQTTSTETGIQAKAFYESNGNIGTYTPGRVDDYFYSIRLVRHE